MQVHFLVLILAVSSAIWAAPVKDDAETCGYASCHTLKEGFINVHIVPHTHDDVGWLKTVDQYFYGTNTTIQRAGVQYILDSVVEALKQDADRRFIYVETAFFWKWWIQQHDTVKAQVRKFVQNGQLEFIGGAWSMNDEAATHYHSIVDQFTWGLRKLNDTFGTCGRPKIGWQIDPFGHSREMASIFAQLGFDGLLLGRIDYQEKITRLETKTPEMIWRGSANLGQKSDIFTGVMFNTYGPPPGFCFDELCTDDPIVDDVKSPLYNVPQKVEQFFAYLKNMTEGYATNNLILTMGEDFHYQNAHLWFKNLDLLIKYANEQQTNGSLFNLVYSTPSCYVKAIYDETKGKNNWLVKTDDFFPYSSDPHAFWTGYFTSRPTIKRFEREGNNFLQVCKQLYSLANLGPEDYVDLNALREAMGVMQHHDAVTGTEKEHVAHDYERILAQAIEECQFIAASSLSQLITKEKPEEPKPTIAFESCLLSNISSCTPSEDNDKLLVTVYNPLSRPVNKFQRLPVLGTAYSVQDSTGAQLEVEILPIPDSVLKIPGRTSKATNELVFKAADIPPLGYKTFYITKTSGSKVLKKQTANKLKLGSAEFNFNKNTGLITSATINNVTIPVTQEFLYYEGFIGDNKVFENRSSGAYVFRPINKAVKISEAVDTQVYIGDIIAEVHQKYNDWISQVIRVYKDDNLVEFDWLVGPIPEDGPEGKEVISRFTTNLESDKVFYTDSNGRELLKRVRDFRPTWTVDLQEPIAGNYYPVTSKILIRDPKQDLEVAVLNDRAQGGSSLNDGELELMVHRNCLHDDAFGVGEALKEQAFGTGLVARGTHWLVFGKLGNTTNGVSTAALERDIAQRKLLNSWTFIAPTTKTFDDLKSYALDFSGLTKSLPQNIQILTLEPWTEFNFLLRLEHVLEKDEDTTLSQTTTVDLKNLFQNFDIASIKETTLGANQWLEDNERLVFEEGSKIESLSDKWKKSVFEQENRNRYNLNDDTLLNHVKRSPLKDDLDNLQVTMEPMQIRTFIIGVNQK